MTEVEAEERQQNILVDLLRFEEGISAGVANLSHGVTERRAKQLWAVYDADGSGALDLSEVATLVKDMATATIKRVVRKIDALQAATDTPAASASLFASFDTSGDGQVQREEFVAAATKGVQVLHGVVDDEDDAVLAAAKRARAEDTDAAPGAKRTRAAAAGDAARGAASAASEVTSEDWPPPLAGPADGAAALFSEARHRLLLREASFNLPPAMLMRQASFHSLPQPFTAFHRPPKPSKARDAHAAGQREQGGERSRRGRDGRDGGAAVAQVGATDERSLTTTCELRWPLMSPMTDYDGH